MLAMGLSPTSLQGADMSTSSMNLNPSTGSRGVKRMLLAMLVAGASTLALSAWAQPMGPGGMGGPGGMHRHGGMGEHGAMGMPFGGSPERMARRIDHMLDGLKATDAQRTQIKQIAQAAATDLKAQHEARAALRERGAQIFAAPNVDAAAAESVRQQMLQQHDQASRRMLQAMLDVSKVLTPEQRAQLGQRMKQRGDMMRERMGRMQRGS
jgi:Spy/CpxP family protein refolding chaperone